jgi:NhaP-type Na+/H+ or K+/H+ antiporter
MTWRSVWEGIASFFENVLFVPYDAIRELELDSWWLANIFSWIFMIIAAAAFVYWLIQLKHYNEPTEDTYTYNENP